MLSAHQPVCCCMYTHAKYVYPVLLCCIILSTRRTQRKQQWLMAWLLRSINTRWYDTMRTAGFFLVFWTACAGASNQFPVSFRCIFYFVLIIVFVFVQTCAVTDPDLQPPTNIQLRSYEKRCTAVLFSTKTLLTFEVYIYSVQSSEWRCTRCVTCYQQQEQAASRR